MLSTHWFSSLFERWVKVTKSLHFEVIYPKKLYLVPSTVFSAIHRATIFSCTWGWVWLIVFPTVNLLSTNPTRWSNTLKQFVSCCWWIAWVYLTKLWGWHLKVKSFCVFIRALQFLSLSQLRYYHKIARYSIFLF